MIHDVFSPLNLVFQLYSCGEGFVATILKLRYELLRMYGQRSSWSPIFFQPVTEILYSVNDVFFSPAPVGPTCIDNRRGVRSGIIGEEGT